MSKQDLYNVMKNNQFKYTGDLRSSSEVLGNIAKTMKTDQREGEELLGIYNKLQTDKASKYYDPYSQPTNNAVRNLAALGFDLNNLNDQWYDNNEGLILNNLSYNGTTNTPSSPGKKATWDQKVAYQLYQWRNSEDATKKIEKQWQDLQDDIYYWANRSDRNYTNDEIIKEKIDWSKYKDLTDIYNPLTGDEGDKLSPNVYNRAINYSKDALNGVFWAARNGGGTGDIFLDAGHAYLGDGNQYQKDPEITAKVTHGLISYSPYSAGATNDDDLKYFGLSSVDRNWINNNEEQIILSGNKEAIDHLNNLKTGVDYTDHLNGLLTDMRSKIDLYIESGFSAGDIIKAIHNNEEYKDLFDLDPTMANKMADGKIDLGTGKLKNTTSKVDYRWMDIEQEIMDRCTERDNKKDALASAKELTTDTKPVEPVTTQTAPVQEEKAQKQEEPELTKEEYDWKYGTGAYDSTFSESEIAQESAAKKRYQDVAPTVLSAGTDSEKAALQTGNSLLFNKIADFLKNWKADFAVKLTGSVKESIKVDYPDAIRTMTDYENHQKTLEGLTGDYDRISAELSGLEERYQRMQSFSTDEELSKEEYDWRYGLGAYDAAVADGEISFISDPIEKLAIGVNADNGNDEETDWVQLEEKLPMDDVDLGEDEDTALLLNFERDSTGQFVFTGATGNRSEKEYDKDQANELLGYVPYDESVALTDEELYRMNYLSQAKNELESKIREEEDYLNANEQLYNDAKTDRNTTMASAKFLGGLASLAGDNSANELIENIDTAFNLINTPYDPNLLYLPYSYYDMYAENGQIPKEEAYALSSQGAIDYTNAIEAANQAIEAVEAAGVELTEEERKALEGNKTILEQQGKSLAYASLNGNEDFAEKAASGEEKAKSGDYGRIAKAIATGIWIPDLVDYITAPGLSKSYRLIDEYGKYESMLQSMSEDEKNRFFYLLESDGQKAAEDYFKFIIDPDRGELTIRTSGDVTKRAEEFASQNMLTSLVSTFASFFGKQMGNVKAAVYRLGSAIIGQDTSSYNPAFWMSNATAGMRQGTKDFLQKVFGENDITDRLYDVLVGLGDITLARGEMKALGALFEGTKLAEGFGKAAELLNNSVPGKFIVSTVKDAGSILPMSVDAWNKTYQQVFDLTKDAEKANQMAGIAFISDLVSHTVIMKGIHKTFETDPAGFSSKLAAYMYQVVSNANAAGLSTLVTEGFTEKAEKAILGSMSTWGQIYQKYKDQDYPDSMAESLANQEVWGQIWDRVVDSEINAAIRTTIVAGANEFQSRGGFEELGNEIKRTATAAKNAFIRGKNQMFPGKGESIEYDASDGTILDANGNPVEPGVSGYLGAWNTNDETAKDLSIANSIKDASPTAAAVGLSSVLNNPDPDVNKAAGQAIVADFANGKTDIAAALMIQLETNTQNPAEMKSDLVIASLTNGSGHEALRAIVSKLQNGETITAKDVNALHNGVQNDQNANPEGLQAALDAAVKENRIANAAVRIASMDENRNRLLSAESEAENKQQKASDGKAYMVQKQNEVNVAADNLKAAESEYDPKNAPEVGGTLQQQTEKLMGADTAAKQAEDSYAVLKQNADDAKEKLEQTRTEVMNNARQEATVQVEQEMADEQAVRDQQAQAAAEAEQQRIDLMNQEAEAEAAERQANLDNARRMIAERTGMTGEQLERNAARMADLMEQKKRGQVDTDKPLSEQDVKGFARSISRQTGMTFTVEDLGDPLKFRGMIVGKNNIILNSRLSTGQALLEAANHEVIHGLEDTGAYIPFADVALKMMYGGRGTAAYNQAIREKIQEYGSIGKTLGVNQPEVLEGAEHELVADFGRLNMVNRKFIRKVVAQGIGGQTKASIGKSLSLLKGYKFKGAAKRTVNNMQKAERLYMEAIDERARMVKEGYNGHTGITQFSITSTAQAAGLTVEVTDDNDYRYKLYDADRNEIAPGEFTPEMIVGTPVGKVIDLPATIVRDELGTKVRNGLMTQEEADTEYNKRLPELQKAADDQRRFMSDIINMIGQYQDAAMVWELAGSLAFSTLKTNGDPQYTDSDDMGTICTKTQAILNVISDTQVRLGRGLTKKEIDGVVYNEVGKGVYDEETGKWKHGATPCPPCYVYATWVNKPARLEMIRQYQNKFGDWTSEQINEFMNAPAPSSKKAVTEKNRQKLWISTCLADEHKDPTTGESTWTRKENPSICPDDILLDLRRSGDMATQYPGTWKFMQKGGNAQGKAIAPYSDSRLGETIIGKAIGAGELNARLLSDAQNAGNPDYIPQFVNPFLTGDDEKAKEYFVKAVKKAKAQNLMGGQRWQSWSDARAEWGSDYLMEMLTMQAIGAKVQTYTKVPEMLPLLASAGFEVNMSLMPEGDGFKHNEDGSIVMDEDGNPKLAFSRVTGIDPEAAEAFAKQYGEKGNVQPMVVGISDEHIKAALAGDYITFVIPFHGSGGSVKRLQHLMSLLKEKMNSGNDYTKAQSDKFLSGETNTNPNWALREAIITGNYDSLTDEQKQVIDDNDYLRKLYEDRYINEGSDAYGVFFSKGAAQQIYPYEYWDKSTTLATADENSRRFIEYCNMLGVIPRFSGLQKANGTEYANFSGRKVNNDGSVTYEPVKGYWKLLIDRPMYKRVYDENGKLIKDQCTYRDPEVVNVGNIEVTAMPMAANNTVGHSNDETRMITDRVIQQLLLNKGPATASYSGNMTLGNTPAEERIENAPIIKQAMYADSDVQLSGPGDLSDEELIQLIKETEGRKPTDLGMIRKQPRSKEFESVLARLNNNEDVSAEEINSTPEMQFGNANVRQGYSINPSITKKYPRYSETYIQDVQAELSPEQVEEQYRIKAVLDSQGSISGYNSKGKLERGGEIKQGRRADVIIGLPASGKSSIADYISYKHNSGFLDSDDVKKEIKGYDNGLGGNYTHPESKFINEWREREAISRGDNVILPVLGDDVESLVKRLANYTKNGYDIHMHWVDLPQNKAIGRALSRYDHNGRYFSVDLLKSIDPEAIAESYEFFKTKLGGIISGYSKWDNDVNIGEHPRNVEASDPDETELFGEIRSISGLRPESGTDMGTVEQDDTGSLGTWIDNGSGYRGLTGDTGNSTDNNGAFSIGGDLSDAELLSLAADNGLISPEMIPYSYVPSTSINFGTRQRQFGSKTAQESNALHDQVKEYLYNNSSYIPDTNDAQINRALDWVQNHATESDPDGYYASLREVMDPDFNYRTADGQAQMLTVMGMAALKADQGDERALQDEINLADAYNEQGTDLAQALQARKLFRLMTPVGRKALLQREEDRMNKSLEDLGKKYRVSIPDELLEEGANAKTEKEFREVKKKIRQALNEQLPVTWAERIIGWRMLSMLSAPKTHIRNVVGNSLFVPVVGAKNKVAAAIEIGAQAAGWIDKSERTKTLGLANPESRKFASSRADEIEDILRGNAKYGEGDKRQQERKIFGTKDNVISKTFGKALQWWYDKNGNALEREDWWFLKYHYTRALGGYMTARGLKPEDMKGTVLEDADLYAIQEAHKATYRDESGVANWMNKIGSKKTNAENNKALSVIQWIVNTRFPFKRTPINIAKRGIEYSPVGAAKSMTYDLAHLKQYLDAQNGKLEKTPKSAISPTEWIDKFAAGLTGTGIMIAGVVAAALGIARAGLDNKDPEDQIAKMAGEQEYSIRPGKITGLELIDEDVSMTLDWAAPVVLPFFTGVGLKEYLEDKGFSVGGILDLMMEVTEPMMNMSFMSGVSDLFKNNGYSTKDGFWQFIEKTGINFLTSLVPTWSGQIASIANGRKTTYSGGESLTGDSDIDKMIQQIGNKIPWLNLGGIPYTNTLGEEQEPVIASWAENLLSPAYFSKVDDSDEMNELARLYLLDPEDNKAIIPSEPQKTITVNGEKIQLNGEQYTKLKADHGAVWRDTTQRLISNPMYELASDDSRAAMYDLADTYATQVAKYMTDNLYKMDSWAENAYRNGNADDVIINKVAEKNKQLYVDSQAKSFAEALLTNNTEDIKKYRDELMEAHADSSEVRKQLTAYFKPLYKEAYQQGDDYTMLQIEFILSNINDYVLLDKQITKYTQKKDFNKWINSSDTISDEEDEDENNWLDTSGSAKPIGMIASAGMSDMPLSRKSFDNMSADEKDEYWYNYDFDSNDPVGQYGKGNIDLNNRKVLQLDNGQIATEESFSFWDDDLQKEVLIPTVIDGRKVSDQEAKEHYYKTGEYLGMFDDWRDADDYAIMLHNRQDWYYHR